MSDQESIPIIKAHVDKLSVLLNDPHPGLGTWALMFGRQMIWLTNYWEHGIEFADAEDR